MTMATVVEIALQAYESWVKSFRCPRGWMDTESNRKKIGEVLIDHVTKTGAADARDVDDIYKQLVADGVEFDIDWASLVPHLDDLGLKNIEEADRFVKANAQRFSTNPTLLNKVNEVLAFCQLHQLHEV